MDTGKGKFEQFETIEEKLNLENKFPGHGGIFRRGEIVEIRGSRFRIKGIKPDELRLKLLKKAEEGNHGTG